MKRIATGKPRTLKRRTLLRGAFGISLGLPWLEMFAGPAQAQQKDPLRLVIFIHPNGVFTEKWFPTITGPGYDLKFSLEPLAPFKDRMIVLGGVDGESAMGKAGSGHTLAGAHLLTCADTMRDGKFGGIGYANSISFDQHLAGHIGADTPIKSLNTGVQADQAASDDMPRARYSYEGADRPIVPQHRPQQVFDNLSGFAAPAGDPNQEAERARLRQERLSVLDFVQDDLQRATSALGQADKLRLEEYLTHMREFEQVVANQVVLSCDAQARPEDLDPDRDENLPFVTDSMLKLTQFAMQCDLTRVAVFQINGEQSYINYGRIDDPILDGISGEGHHNISHHPNDDIAKICQLHSKYVAEYATRLDSVVESTGTLLDNTIILYTNAIEDGQKHNFDNLPHVLLGGKNVLNTGQYLKFDGPATNNDLFVTLLQAFGINETTFGEAEHVNGVLPGILA